MFFYDCAEADICVIITSDSLVHYQMHHFKDVCAYLLQNMRPCVNTAVAVAAGCRKR